MPKALANGIQIYYEVYGEGEPLLLIMGLGANAASWEKQIPAFSRHYKVVAFDNRGSGRSDIPDEPYTIEMFADDTADLMDTLGIASAHVYGVSMGGMIAQALALRHPQRVRTLILAATSCGGPNAVMGSAEVIQSWTQLASLPYEEAYERGLPFLYSDEFIARNKEQLIRDGLNHADLRPPLPALQRQFLAVAQFNAYERLPQMRAPTLILTGTADKVVSPENARILAERIPGSQLVELDGLGHGFLVERAEESNAVVLDFLSRHRLEATN